MERMANVPIVPRLSLDRLTWNTRIRWNLLVEEGLKFRQVDHRSLAYRSDIFFLTIIDGSVDMERNQIRSPCRLAGSYLTSGSNFCSPSVSKYYLPSGCFLARQIVLGAAMCIVVRASRTPILFGGWGVGGTAGWGEG